MYEALAANVPQAEPYGASTKCFLNTLGCLTWRSSAGGCAMRCGARPRFPTCIGIGPTKTIAKLANRIAKDEFALRGVCDLRDETERAAYYDELPVSMVWGISGKTVEKLNRLGITYIAAFVGLEPQQVRDIVTVTGARVQAELRGQSCLPLTLMPPPRQAIEVTRSFGRPGSADRGRSRHARHGGRGCPRRSDCLVIGTSARASCWAS